MLWPSWRGNSFEIVCINHIDQIKAALGISGIQTNEFARRSNNPEKGAQIDLIIQRKDGIINIPELFKMLYQAAICLIKSESDNPKKNPVLPKSGCIMHPLFGSTFIRPVFFKSFYDII